MKCGSLRRHGMLVPATLAAAFLAAVQTPAAAYNHFTSGVGTYNPWQNYFGSGIGSAAMFTGSPSYSAAQYNNQMSYLNQVQTFGRMTGNGGLVTWAQTTGNLWSSYAPSPASSTPAASSSSPFWASGSSLPAGGYDALAAGPISYGHYVQVCHTVPVTTYQTQLVPVTLPGYWTSEWVYGPYTQTVTQTQTVPEQVTTYQTQTQYQAVASGQSLVWSPQGSGSPSNSWYAVGIPSFYTRYGWDTFLQRLAALRSAHPAEDENGISHGDVVTLSGTHLSPHLATTYRIQPIQVQVPVTTTVYVPKQVQVTVTLTGWHYQSVYIPPTTVYEQQSVPVTSYATQCSEQWVPY